MFQWKGFTQEKIQGWLNICAWGQGRGLTSSGLGTLLEFGHVISDGDGLGVIHAAHVRKKRNAKLAALNFCC